MSVVQEHKTWCTEFQDLWQLKQILYEYPSNIISKEQWQSLQESKLLYWLMTEVPMTIERINDGQWMIKTYVGELGP